MTERDRALIVIDLQNDFLPGGSLAVPGGDRVVPVVNRLMTRFDLVVATRDWHPPDHGSFASSHRGKKPGDRVELDGLQQILWPAHCVQGTPGAEPPDDLDTGPIAKVFLKGTDPRIDSYSGFWDNGHRRSTGLERYLDRCGVRRVYLAGLATDVCVKFTALDARRAGLDTWVVEDAVRGIDLEEGDVDRAVAEMNRAGVRFVASDGVG